MDQINLLKLAANKVATGAVNNRQAIKAGASTMLSAAGSITGGATIGGIAGLARGDNRDSTSAFRNFTSGALMGGFGVAAARAILPKLPGIANRFSGASKALAGRAAAKAESKFIGPRQAGWVGSSAMKSWKSSPLGGIAHTASNLGGMALGGMGLAAKHPGATMGAGVLAGAGLYLGSRSSGISSPSMEDMGDAEQISSNRGFANSASGLSLAMHRRRHRS